MLRNIYISGLVLILLISTTGLTYTFHLCKMMSEDETELCEMDHTKVMHSCCNDNEDNGQIFRSFQSDCCDFQTVNKKVSDEFLTLKNDTNKDNTSTVSFINTEILDNNLFNYNQADNNLHNNSPPGRQNNLFIINSSFLI